MLTVTELAILLPAVWRRLWTAGLQVWDSTLDESIVVFWYECDDRIKMVWMTVS